MSDNSINNNSLPLVSIITPSFNAMPYLKETIESIALQDYPNVEHLVMDGGSDDGTVNLLKLYPNIIWVSEKDRGQSHALNKGFQKAKGEIIGWLNADDTYEPGAIRTAVKYLLENEKADMVCSDLNILNEKSDKIGVSISEPFDVVKLLTSNMVKQPTVFMRRKVLNKLKGVNEQYHYVMDQELWLRAGMNGFNIHYLNGVFLANFRMCTGTKSFENASHFKIEWEQIINTSFKHPFFEFLTPAQKNKILKSNIADYHFLSMLESIEKKQRFKAIKHLVMATSKNKRLMISPGLYRILATDFILGKRDKLKKYRKNKSY